MVEMIQIKQKRKQERQKRVQERQKEQFEEMGINLPNKETVKSHQLGPTKLTTHQRMRMKALERQRKYKEACENRQFEFGSEI